MTTFRRVNTHTIAMKPMTQDWQNPEALNKLHVQQNLLHRMYALEDEIAVRQKEVEEIKEQLKRNAE